MMDRNRFEDGFHEQHPERSTYGNKSFGDCIQHVRQAWEDIRVIQPTDSSIHTAWKKFRLALQDACMRYSSTLTDPTKHGPADANEREELLALYREALGRFPENGDPALRRWLQNFPPNFLNASNLEELEQSLDQALAVIERVN